MQRLKFGWMLSRLGLLCLALLCLVPNLVLARQIEDSFLHPAPENCWSYSAWSAAKTNDPNSSNESERLLAEPEIREFIDDLIQRAGLLAPAMVADQPEEIQALVHELGPMLAESVFKNAGCFFIQDFKLPNGRNGDMPSLKALLMIDAGGNAQPLVDLFTKLYSLEGEAPGKTGIEGVTFTKIELGGESGDEPGGESGLEILLGNVDGKLMIGVGQDTIEGALRRMAKQQIPTWVREFKSRERINRVTNFSYFNVEEIRGVFESMGGPEATMVIGFSGLGNVDTIETATGFSEKQSISRMLIRTDGRPEGLLDLASADGIQSSELQQFPDDALFATGISIDPGRVFRFFQMASIQLGGRNDDFGQFLEEFKRETGVDLKRDLVDNVGKTWTLYNGAGDGWLSGLTLTGTLKDSQGLAEASQRLIKRIVKETAGDRYAPKFFERTVGEHKIYTLRVPQTPFPIEPSWCVADDRIILGLYPQAVQTALKPQDGANALITQSHFDFLSQPFSGELQDARLIGMAYIDTATQFELSYPYVLVMANMGRGMIDEILGLRSESSGAITELVSGIRIPPARTIHQHLKPSLLAIRQTDSGIEFESRQTIPAMDIGYVAPLAVGMILPGIQQASASAKRTQSANNIRQQVLAAMNFESVHQNFPAGYSTNADGEPLLSWRVHVLPFIEQNNLYDRFKLDEPWDSANNKPLAELMPDVFRSPVSNAKPGMTVYRGVGGKTGVLGPPRRPGGAVGGVGFGNITDGSSNTIFLVETSDELAVPWSKPDLGLNPDEFELSTIFGLYPNGTNAGYCDGSVHFLPNTLDKRVFRFLMEMNDGNIIPDFDGSNRNRRRQRREEPKPVDPRFKLDNGEVELTIDHLLSADEKAELSDRQKQNALRQVALSLLNFESAYQGFPNAYTTDDQGQPLLSWRVQVLPFLEENGLHRQFRMGEPWDSEHNLALVKQMPDCFRLSDAPAAEGKTTVMAMGGPQGMLRKPSEGKNGNRSQRGLGFAQVRDGSSNTLLLINSPDELAVEWTKPTEFEPDMAMLKKMLAQKFVASFADGSIKQIPAGFSAEQFKAMSTVAGGEVTRAIKAGLLGR